MSHWINTKSITGNIYIIIVVVVVVVQQRGKGNATGNKEKEEYRNGIRMNVRKGVLWKKSWNVVDLEELTKDIIENERRSERKKER